jgi:hypothetical protein
MATKNSLSELIKTNGDAETADAEALAEIVAKAEAAMRTIADGAKTKTEAINSAAQVRNLEFRMQSDILRRKEEQEHLERWQARMNENVVEMTAESLATSCFSERRRGTAERHGV